MVGGTLRNDKFRVKTSLTTILYRNSHALRVKKKQKIANALLCQVLKDMATV